MNRPLAEASVLLYAMKKTEVFPTYSEEKLVINRPNSYKLNLQYKLPTYMVYKSIKIVSLEIDGLEARELEINNGH